MENNCAILVNSCDRYEEAWNPFFTLFKKYWPECPFPLYLNTETAVCKIDGVTTLVQKDDRNIAWSDRLRNAVERIESEFVLLFLDDFFLMERVNHKEVIRTVEIMKQEEDIAVFYFKHSTGQIPSVCEYGDYLRMDPNKKYILNFQVGLWRKSALLELIQPGLSPWEIEENKTPRIQEKWRFYCPQKGSYTDCSQDVFPYLWALKAGYGICKSKWLWNNKKFFKKEGIKVEFQKLGQMSKFTYQTDEMKRKIKQRIESIRKK